LSSHPRRFEIVVAADEESGIGAAGRIPWRLPGELAHFRRLTVGEGGNSVLMGRVTWESLPARFRPLPERCNVVLTRQPEYPLPDGVLRAADLDRALDLAPLPGRVFVIGGAELYRAALAHPGCTLIHLTRVRGCHHCDRFLPQLSASDWEEIPPAKDAPAPSGPGWSYHVLRKRSRDPLSP